MFAGQTGWDENKHLALLSVFVFSGACFESIQELWIVLHFRESSEIPSSGYREFHARNFRHGKTLSQVFAVKIYTLRFLDVFMPCKGNRNRISESPRCESRFGWSVAGIVELLQLSPQ
eukprot:symbB.v1.2.024916.t1/scaffold2391.1/size80316/4